MPLNTNSMLDAIEGSPIRRFAALARTTPDCVSLTLGEPGEDTPRPICEQVTADLEAGATHYPPNPGMLHLRRTIASWERAHGVGWATHDDVVVTIGATEALSSTLTALLEPGDEVIVVRPAFTLYESLVRLHGATPVPLDIAQTDFQVSGEALRQAVSSRTKAIVVCSPNNPTGCALNTASLDAIADAALRHDFYVICDDVYAELTYTKAFERLAAHRMDIADRVIVVGSLSKPWAMTGWRVGWALTRGEVFQAIAKVHQLTVSCSPAMLQGAAVVALRTPTDDMRATYAKRRAKVKRALGDMELAAPRLDGAFYAFPRVSDLGLDDVTFCERAIREHGVGLVPGSFFGGAGHVRLSYCCDDDSLARGLSRLAAFVSDLRG